MAYKTLGGLGWLTILASLSTLLTPEVTPKCLTVSEGITLSLTLFLGQKWLPTLPLVKSCMSVMTQLRH